jgi:ABC-type uncharacterized transport system involved in gliding motility auxiliary subunit
MPSKIAVFRTNVIVMIGVVLGIVILINFVASRHNKRFDTTAGGEFSLSDQTLKLLRNLQNELQIVVFDKPGSHIRQEAEDILAEYTYHSDKLKIEFVDPDQSPARAEKNKIMRYGTLVLQYDGKVEKIESVKEAAITNAIVKVTRKEKKTIYFLEGHGEHDIESNEKDGYSLVYTALLDQNYDTKKLLLMREASIPSAASVLVVAGPTKDFFPNELEAIAQFIRSGGNVFFLLDPPPATGLKDFLSKYGIKVGQDMLVDKLSRLFGGDYFMPVITQYTVHPITENFKVASFLPLARSISPDSNPPDNMDIISLAKTNEGSWAEVDLENQEVKFDEGKDIKGPVSIAVVVEARFKPEAVSAEEPEKTKQSEQQETETEEKEEEKETIAKLVALGNSDLANNTYLNLSGNRDLFLNIISYLAEEEDLISIRPKTTKQHTISLTEDQMGLVFYLSVIILPLLAMTTGIVVWAKRRKL